MRVQSFAIGLFFASSRAQAARAFVTRTTINNNVIMSLRRTVVPRTTKSTTRTTTTSVRGGSGSSTTKLSAAVPPFNNAPLWLGSGIIVAANALGFGITLVAPAFHYHVDLLGTGAFAAAALPTFLYSKNNQRVQWSSAAVMTWSVKLASFLLYRVLQTDHDTRLDAILATPSSAAGFWIVSAAWGLLCSLPHALGTTAAATGNPIVLRAGAALYGVGLLTETLADYQKWIFKQQHPGQFCNTGLWSISQHPNWLGNLLLWSGIFVMNAPALIDRAAWTTSTKASLWNKVWSCRRLALALIGPAFMWTLFDAQATGKLLNSLEASKARHGYGEDPLFTNYIDTTPLIFPNPLMWFRS
jgi:steroid 5-alpha reductase family enzyme